MSNDGHDYSYVTCPKCDGSRKQPMKGSRAGDVGAEEDCSRCGGTGTVPENERSHGSW